MQMQLCLVRAWGRAQALPSFYKPHWQRQYQMCIRDRQKGAERKADAVPAGQALTMATQYGAQALGTCGGVLQPGYKADLILLDVDQPHMVPMHNASSQVVYSAQGSDVYLTMVNGRILYQAGEYKTCLLYTSRCV